MAAGGTGFSSRSGRELGLRDCSIDCRFFDQLMDKAFKRYPEAAEDLMEVKDNHKIDELGETLSAIEGYLLEVASVHYEMDNIKKVIDEGGEILREHCESEEGSQTITDVYERHFEDIKSRDARDVNTHPAVVGYRRILEEEGEGEDLEGDEELMMGQVQRSLVCPLTQKELENPVKNTACGHVYSKEAVLAHVRSRPSGRAKCPVGGCPEMILEQYLVADKEAERALRRRKK